MIKFKICFGCAHEKVIYKCIQGKRYCRDCTRKIDPPSKLRYRSVTKMAKHRTYSDLATIFKQDHPECEVKLPGCSTFTDDIHHLYSGMDRSKFELDITTWKATCRSCHTDLHDNYTSEQLVEMGLKLIDYTNA